MAYMNRLGIWGEGTPFREFSDFIQAVERRCVCRSWLALSKMGGATVRLFAQLFPKFQLGPCENNFPLKMVFFFFQSSEVWAPWK